MLTWHAQPYMAYKQVQPKADTLKLARQQAGLLLEQALDETITCEAALARWPWDKNQEAERDESLKVAYRALWHFYSDEAAMSQEAFYLDVQLHLLRQMARILQKGDALPFDLIMGYQKAPQQTSVPQFYSTEENWWSLKEWQQAVAEALHDWKTLWLESKSQWALGKGFIKEAVEQGTQSLQRFKLPALEPTPIKLTATANLNRQATYSAKTAISASKLAALIQAETSNSKAVNTTQHAQDILQATFSGTTLSQGRWPTSQPAAGLRFQQALPPQYSANQNSKSIRNTNNKPPSKKQRGFEAVSF